MSLVNRQNSVAQLRHHQLGIQSSILHRRDAIRAGGAGLLGLNLPKLIAARERSESLLVQRAKRVIFLFQWGGPSHIDTFDMKPNAPEEIRGPLKPIQSVVPGMPVCELMPRMSKYMDKVCLIRSVHHTMTNHNSAGYYALSGHEPPSNDQRLRDSLDLYPAYGSVVDHLAPAKTGMPTSVSYPYTIRDGSITPGQHASFLGKAHDPFFFENDPNDDAFTLPQLRLPAGLSASRLNRRRFIQQTIDNQTALLENSGAAKGFDQYYERAIRMLTSDKVRSAFDLTEESDKVRESYGRTTYGQSCLLARRLAESGVKFVTVYFSNSIGGQSVEKGGWDTHGFNDTRMYEIIPKYHFPITEQTLPTLLDDLQQRGLYDDTLVVWMGEFGRTPKINKNVSRDHWPQCYTVLLAGGCVKQGFVYGSSDAHGATPDENPVRPEDLAATIYYALGIDPATEIYTRDDRPLVIGGDPITEVFA